MAKYIEREALLNRIKTLQETESATVGKKQFADGYFFGLDEAEIIAMQAPAADVVEVVRCKDCKYFKPNAILGVIECGTCIRVSSFEPLELTNRIESDYCSYGERRSQ